MGVRQPEAYRPPGASRVTPSFVGGLKADTAAPLNPAALAAHKETLAAAALKKAQEAESKAAKAALRLEKERAEKEKKEALLKAKEQAAQEEKDRRERALKAAEGAVKSQLKGEELVAFLQDTPALGQDITAGALASTVLSQLEDPSSIKWLSAAEYGAALVFLTKDRGASSQVELLYAVQTHCHANKFPKVESKGKTLRLIDVIFRLLYAGELVDVSGFTAWTEDDNEVLQAPGKLDAIVQTTEFIAWLNEPEVEDFEDEEEGDEEGFDGHQRTA